MTPRTYAYAILCVVAGMAVTLANHPKKPAVELVSADIPPGSVVVYDRDGNWHQTPIPGGFVEGDIWATPEGLHIYWHGRERKMLDFIGSDELKR